MEKKKILIVDDEKDLLIILEKRLTKEGYAVIKADNGKDAIIMAKKEMPDLIMLDILMPEMSGEQAASKLKADPQTKNIPIMFLTCLFTKEDELMQGHDIGGNVFVAKPYNPDELLSEIKKHIT